MGEPKILIAGAGPTGLVLALWLAQAKIPFRLIDKASGPGTASRAMAVQARTLEFYRQMGIAEDVIASGFRMDRLHLRNLSREIARIPLGDVGKGESPFPFVLSYPQDDHERLLIDRLRILGHEVEWETELASFTQNDDGVQAVLHQRGGVSNWSGAYLCGCDGAHSAVREGMGGGFPGGTYDQLFFVADVVADGQWSDRDIQAYLALKSFCLAFPVRSERMFRFIGLVPTALRERDDITFDDVRDGVEQMTGTQVKNVNWFSTYRVHHRVAEHFQQGRAFLAGDAGHVHSPAGGQGMNTGIGDAVNLAWKLAAVLQGHANASLLETYEAERLPFARSLVATTDRIFEGVVGKGLGPRLMRVLFFPLVLPLLLRFAAVRRWQFRLVSQVRIAYSASALSVGRAGRVYAGDRLPWLEVEDNYAPLRSHNWQLHVCGRPTTDLQAFAAESGLALHAWPWTKEAPRAGFAQDAIYLVRPDGHVGFAGGKDDLPGLRSYRDRFGILCR